MNKPKEGFYLEPCSGKPKARCRKCHAAKEIQRRREKSPGYVEHAPYVPTPEQIAEAAAAIRAGWTDNVRNSRAGFDPSLYGVETRVVSGHRIGRNGMWEINNADDG